ncbi:hypothetical protein MPL3365_170068 [Mesorhizobium plurifarium]|uniref:Uncharacterized protein n=1 Tax=Mesorhizobium plurifarium TaxID=69974 RepID=A0A090FYR7_MESPL|nr:hypothetical protein MPL3365_170068 [Mesorhizobium plurifarium]
MERMDTRCTEFVIGRSPQTSNFRTDIVSLLISQTGHFRDREDTYLFPRMYCFEPAVIELEQPTTATLLDIHV